MNLPLEGWLGGGWLPMGLEWMRKPAGSLAEAHHD